MRADQAELPRPVDGPDPECVKGHGASARGGLDRGGLPRPEKGRSYQGQAMPFGMSAADVPAKLSDSSPLAVLA
jgi:mycofactocin biosynthetic radical S-adenosylmethionine protein MftC